MTFIDLADAVAQSAATDRLSFGVRKSAVEFITVGAVNLYRIDGQDMPMLADTGTVTVGTVVVWLDQLDPVALGPLRSG